MTFSAVPVLPPTKKPAIAAPLAEPLVALRRMMKRIASLVSGLITRTPIFFASSSLRLRKVGLIRMPPFTSALTAIKACRGATARPWPNAIVIVLSSPQRGGTSGMAFSGSSVTSRSSWPVFLKKALTLDADAEGHPRRADVRGMDEHLRHGQHAMGRVVIVDLEAAVAQGGARVEARIDGELARVERHRRGQRLEGRAHLEHADVDPVDPVLFERVDRIVGVEVGQRDEPDHLAGVDVHDGGGAGLGLELGGAYREFVAQRVLNPQIERELDGLKVRRVGRKPRAGQVLQPLRVDMLLDARDADVVDAGEAENMRRRDAVRVDALVLGHEADARNAEAMHLGLLARRDLALDPGEPPPLVQLGAQFA